MKRRDFLQKAAGCCACAALAPLSASAREEAAIHVKSFSLEELSIQQLRQLMVSRRETALSLTKKYLRRIHEIDQAGPMLRSVIELNPDALEIAKTLDQEWRGRGPRGPLHGIPVLIKDNIDTRDRMMTTAGSLALVGAKPPRDAFVVQKLREAGAVILGKTNLSEWANFRSNHSSSGWSGRGGQSRSPYVIDRNPSGSSSGSGVAAAASLCAVAVGTETDGSILSPSSFNGLVGIKPTLGLISRDGIIPIAHSQDTAGPMARNVRDAAILLGVLAGADPNDSATRENAGKVRLDYTASLDPDGLRGARIGVPRKFFRPGRLEESMKHALEVLKQLGAVLVDPADLPSHGKFGDAEYQVLLYEFKADLNSYFARLGPAAPVHSLKDVIEFNDRNRAREMPHFGQEILLQAEEKGPLTEPAYLEALEKCRRLARAEGIDAVMDENRLDALVAPTGGPAHKIDLVYGNRDTGGSTTPAAVAGYPSITVPAGEISGLPVGLSFFGRKYTESLLLKFAFAFEQATHFRRAPKFLRSLETEG